MFGLIIKSPKKLLIKLLLVFTPIYAVAFFTQSMVYVLPTVAVFLLFGTSISSENDAVDAKSENENEPDSAD